MTSRKEGVTQPPSHLFDPPSCIIPVVDPSRSDERRVQLVDVVGGHEDDSPLGGGDAVDGVQQAGERQTVQTLVVEIILAKWLKDLWLMANQPY